MNDADARDAHLQAALHHAPDRDLAAPDAVSARILAQARAAVPARAAASQPGWVERWFGWMSRPVAAGAFGTLLIAGFVGLMWRGGPPPEAMPGADREAPAAAAPAPAPAPAATPAPAPAAVAEQAAVPPAPMPAAPPPERRAAALPAPAPAAKEVARPSAVGATAADAAANKTAAPAGPAPATAPAPAPAVAPAPPPAPAPAPAAAPALAAAPAAAAAPTPAAAPAAALPRAALRQRSDAAAFDPLVPALAVLAQSPGSPLQARLQRLQQRLASPWVPGGAPPVDGGETVSDAQGQRLGRLWVTGPVILWLDPDGNLWRATLRDE